MVLEIIDSLHLAHECLIETLNLLHFDLILKPLQLLNLLLELQKSLIEHPNMLIPRTYLTIERVYNMLSLQ